MSEPLAESFRGLFLALANPAAVNDDVTFIGNAINFDFAEVKFAEVYGWLSPRFTSIISTRTAVARSSRVLCSRPRERFGSHRFLYLAGLAAAILFDYVGTGPRLIHRRPLGCSGHVARLGRSKEQRDAGELFGLAKAADRQMIGTFLDGRGDSGLAPRCVS